MADPAPHDPAQEREDPLQEGGSQREAPGYDPSQAGYAGTLGSLGDGDTLPLAEAECGAMLQCGRCDEITSWRFKLDPFVLQQVPIEWDGRIECV